ncbi:MAG: hypothetical protein GY798_17105 [Hyphomicrobiales bacterium]|nr:hypothetical protein [Hyphomicrobiales bacterium]
MGICGETFQDKSRTSAGEAPASDVSEVFDTSDSSRSRNSGWSLVRWAGALTVGAFVFAAPAAAITFDGTYVVSYNDSDPGLVVHVDAPPGTLSSFDLDVGGSTGWFPLFDIWTEECCVNQDDFVAQPIDVSYTFTSPPPGFTDSVDGETAGSSFFGIIEWGRVSWNDPVAFAFGNGGILLAYLSDETFSAGLFGLGTRGATVNAKFTLQVAPVPIPPAIALFAGGLGALGYLAMRRRRKEAPNEASNDFSAG